MPLTIENAEVERLARELAERAGSSTTEVIRLALLDHKERLGPSGVEGRRQRLLDFLEQKVWPQIPESARRPWSKQEEEDALGYGPHGEPT